MPCIVFLVVLILIAILIAFALPILGLTTILGISLLNVASTQPAQTSPPIISEAKIEQPNLSTYSQNGIHFTYPSDEKISENLENIVSDYKNQIFVKRQSIFDLVNTCEKRRGDAYSIKDKYEKALNHFKTTGDIAGMNVVDNIGCAWTAGNIYSEKIDTGTNGILFHNVQSNDSLTLSTFYSQMMFFVNENEIITITFNYKAYPAIKKAIQRYDTNNVDTEDLAKEVSDYLTNGKPIKTDSIKAFEEAELQFRDTIDSIDITI